MAILAIETSARICGVAIITLQERRLLWEQNEQMQRDHSRMLLPMILTAMQRTHKKPEDIEAIATSSGPGSFTGIRIGMSTAKALAVAWQLPLLSVGSLEAVAMNVEPGTLALVSVDARRGLYYTAAFYKSARAQTEPVLAVGLRSPKDTLDALLEAGHKSATLIGDGAVALSDYAETARPAACLKAHTGLWYPTSGNVAHLAVHEHDLGKALPAQDVAPTYFRRSQAERTHHGRG